MSLYAIHLANGKTANTSPLRLLGRLLSGTGVIESTGFTVSAQGTPTMSLNISGSATSDNLAIITSTGDVYHGWNTATATVTISSNATGVSKRDAVVAYIDTAMTSSTADNPGGLVLTTVRGSGTDTVPTDAEINTAVSSKPWIRLANVFVANGASSINSGNITDTRTFATLDGKYLKPASVTADKIDSAAITLGYAQRTTTQSSITTLVDLTGLTTTVTVPSGGRRVKITAQVSFNGGTADASFQLAIQEDGSTISFGNYVNRVSGNTYTVSHIFSKIPTAGSHTYKLQGSITAGTTSINASSTNPAFILVELI